MLGGEGAHPPADACDFARYCSALDFWSINDHAEGLSSQAWTDTVQSIRACNERAGDAANPDTVAYLGWEWTQVGTTPEEHFGHKNVVLPGLADDEIPARPIAAAGQALDIRTRPPRPFGRGLLALFGGGRMHDLAAYLTRNARQDLCEDGVNTRDLPADCLEVAATPDVLFRKLDEWGFDSIVIPHGTTWGFYTPPGSSWDKQLRGNLHDPKRQTLIEVYSGHGDSEVYRPWRAVERGPDGEAICPEPRPDYLPTCWQAGEIIRKRCLAEGTSAEECDERAAETRELAADAGGQAHLVVPGARAAEWLDAGQCRDCSEPAFNYRPGGSVQYILSLSNFDDDPAKPRRFHFGFISSSDNHSARPGTGYKENNRDGIHRIEDPRPEFAVAHRLLLPRAARGAGVPAAPLRSERHPPPGLPAHGGGATDLLLPDGRARGRSRRRPRSRFHLAGRQATRGVRHHGAAHPALVRPAEPAGLQRAHRRHGERGEDAGRADLPGARGGIVRAEARLSRVRGRGAVARGHPAPVQGRVLQPVRRAAPHLAHRAGPHPAPGRAGRGPRRPHRRSLEDGGLRAQPRGLRGHLRRPGLRDGRARRRLLRPCLRGAGARHQRRTGPTASTTPRGAA